MRKARTIEFPKIELLFRPVPLSFIFLPKMTNKTFLLILQEIDDHFTVV